MMLLHPLGLVGQPVLAHADADRRVAQLRPAVAGDDVVAGLGEVFHHRLRQPAAPQREEGLPRQLRVAVPGRPLAGDLGVDGVLIIVSVPPAGGDEDRPEAQGVQKGRVPHAAVEVPHVEAVQAD